MRVRTALGVTDAHAHTRVFRRAEGTVNRLDAVVAACGAACLDLDTAEFQVHVIVNHHNMVGLDLVIGANGSHRIAGIIHISQRLGQKELDGAAVQVHHAFTEHGQALVIGEVHRPTFGEHVGGHEAHVVPRVLIFFAGVAQSRNQPEIRCHNPLLVRLPIFPYARSVRSVRHARVRLAHWPMPGRIQPSRLYSTPPSSSFAPAFSHFS